MVLRQEWGYWGIRKVRTGVVCNTSDSLVKPSKSDPLRVEQYDDPLDKEVRTSRKTWKMW